MQAALLTSNRETWETPKELFDALDGEFSFTRDVCAEPETAKCKRFWTVEDDALAKRWTGRCWMNPPYGKKIAAFMRKAWLESQSNAECVVCLVPARTDTAWWHDYAAKGEVRFLRGRVKFVGAKFSAPFPSAIVVFKRAS